MCQLRRAIVAAAGIALSSCGDSSSGPSAPSPPPQTIPGVVSIVVAGTPPAVGASTQFTALAVLMDGSNQAVTSQATWASSNAAIASVNISGMVTAVASGSVEISATYGTIRGSLAFAVAPPPTYTLSGTITDSGSGRGLATATVTVREASGVSKSGGTDIAGRYSIVGLAAGDTEVTAVAPGYVAVTRAIRISGNATLTVALPRVTACPTIGFDELPQNGAPFTTYTACGFTVTPTTSNWVSSGYGNPAASIEFRTGAGTTAVGEVIVTAAGVKFRFLSIDLYSSTTQIPYTVTGIANSATVFNIQATHPYTSGTFRTAVNPQPAVQVDVLLIRLTNPAACCANPMGFDNLRLMF